ncbi:carbon storage regulator [Paenibacillus forsythiae]|uniref:Carbon storage regulator n=2 Tax=Paenibacillus forsythiae TaxID=365616 RepID=A0ABU3HC27_9BACL|nr:carbon storage regulator [Paenibacillus forsythiae]
MISDTIEVIILETDGDMVKLGIKAPKEVGIHRKEVYLVIQESNKEASSDRKALVKRLTDWQEK